jgi:hypothetical protein
MGPAYRGTVEDFESTVHLPSYKVKVEEQIHWLNNNISKKEEAMKTLDRLIHS